MERLLSKMIQADVSNIISNKSENGKHNAWVCVYNMHDISYIHFMVGPPISLNFDSEAICAVSVNEQPQ